MFTKIEEFRLFLERLTVQKYLQKSKNWPDHHKEITESDVANFKIAYHVTHPDTAQIINVTQTLLPHNSPSDLPSNIKAYKMRLFLVFDTKTLDDIVVMQSMRYWERGTDTPTLQVFVIDWEKYAKDHPHVQIYMDEDFSYFEKERGRYGSYYIKEPISLKYVKEIKSKRSKKDF